MNNKAIGVFDLGVGGLTVVKEIQKLLPSEEIIFLGDCESAPDGTESKSAIINSSQKQTRFLLNHQVKLLVIACNTITATCLEEIKKISSVPVIGVINPTAKMAAKVSKTKSIGIIATNTTINSNAYQKNLQSIDQNIQVFAQACPLFVPLVENNLVDNPITKIIALQYLNKYLVTNINTIILGCTHFPFLSSVIQDVLGNKFQLIDSAKPTALEIKKFMEKNHLQKTLKIKPNHQFFFTGKAKEAKNIALKIFDKDKLINFKQITL